MVASKKEKTESMPKAQKLSKVIRLPDAESRIAERAYFKAESRGFAPGYEMDDWLAAEREFTL